ncbi:hypothetical protein [Pleomorphomonas oryzae]|uniref:hypothetical protein n=1 Tax=Pleomorphomonas oryzae TaxID=261934 RepID=UPI00047961A1|nr:hypothetical protein [Pleomorphomonas oryzae]
MSLSFSPTEAVALAAPHVARAWLVEFDLPSGLLRLHSGAGVVTVGGREWSGVSDPTIPGRMVSVGQVQEPRFGAAAAITFQLGGVTADFLKSLRKVAVEGRSAKVYFATFDGETQQVIGSPRLLFPRGRMTAPARRWEGIGIRTVEITVENVFSSLNYAPGGRWNQADQRRRYPGDKGLDFIGVDVVENWQ